VSIIKRSCSQKSLEHVQHELDAIPAHIMDALAEKGWGIYITAGETTGSFIGLTTKGTARYCGRNVNNDGSHVSFGPKRIILHDEFARVKGFNVVAHEIGHAMEMVFLNQLIDVLGPAGSHVPGVPLDWYAACNWHERFAQAWAAYFTPDGTPKLWYAVHDRSELREKEPVIYGAIDAIVRMGV